MPDFALIKRLHLGLPGYPERLEKRDRIVNELSRRQSAQKAANPHGRFASAERFVLEEMLEAGEPLEELDQRISARVVAEQSGGAALRELVEMRTRLNDELKAAELNHYDALPVLHAALTERVEEAKALGALDEIATDAATKRSKRHADRDRLCELSVELGTVRFEQTIVLRAAGHELGAKVSILHVLRNVEGVFPNKGWAPWLAPGWLGKRGSDERREIDTPWPRPLMGALIGEEFGLWALLAGADQWVPTLDQYDAAATALTRKAREPREDDGRFGEWYDPGPQARYERPRNLSQRSR